MPTNPYFNTTPPDVTSEQELLNDLVVESIQINGINCYYLPRSSLDIQDQFYGEDPVATFNLAYIIEMYMQNAKGPDGPSEFITKFLEEIKDSGRFLVARRTFKKLVPNLVRPREGDLIWVPFLNNLYEIKFVEEDEDYHSLGIRTPLYYYYNLKVEMFKFNNERFNTGVKDIDQVGKDYAYTISLGVTLTANVDAGGNYAVGERVYQGANVAFANTSAYVKSWTASNNNLQIIHITGTLANNIQIKGNTSRASYTVSTFDPYSFSAVDEEVADNTLARDEANLILDLENESNPFGAP